MRQHPHTTAFILAGGRSSRMGQDKAFLRLGRLSLLEHTMLTAKEICETVTLVGNKERLRPYGWVVEDVYAGQGPLAGIHAGLTSTTAEEWNLFLAVDTPAIEAKFLDFLLQTARWSAQMVTVPRWDGRYQPLCAVYRPEFAAIAEKALKAQKNKIDPLFDVKLTRVVEEHEIKAAGFGAGIFDNVNTPEDWQRVQQQMATGLGTGA